MNTFPEIFEAQVGRTPDAEAVVADGDRLSYRERSLAAVWAQVLGRADVGIHDDFFELGGDSIHAILICARAARTSVYDGGADEVLFGATVSGRPAELPGVESIVGLLINTLPVRLRLRPAADLVTWLRRTGGRLCRARFRGGGGYAGRPQDGSGVRPSRSHLSGPTPGRHARRRPSGGAADPGVVVAAVWRQVLDVEHVGVADERRRLGSIVALHHDGRGAAGLERVVAAGGKLGIHASAREGYLRVALHGWHTEDDVERLRRWLAG